MAGFNQQGPMNQGPMTGRGMGVCTGTVQAEGFGGRLNGQGRGRGGCQAGRRAMGFGGPYNQPPQQLTRPESALQNQVNTLEAEILALKKQLQDNQ